MNLPERIAIIETDQIHGKEDIQRLRNDIKELITFVKAHMVREEEDREELLTRIRNIEMAQSRMKSFWAGITFTVSMVWGIGAALLYFFGKASV